MKAKRTFITCCSIFLLLSYAFLNLFESGDDKYGEGDGPSTSLYSTLNHSGAEKAAADGLVVNGSRTTESIRRMIQKAHKGIDSHVLIVGGSASQGADLGPNGMKLDYHAKFAQWWDENIGKPTGTRLRRHVIAVGAMTSEYFGLCWRDYLADGEMIDLVISEFALNDFDSRRYIYYYERFLRSVLLYNSQPGFLTASFSSVDQFRRITGSKYMGFGCRERTRETKRRRISVHYNTTVISVKAHICHQLKQYGSQYEVKEKEMYVRHHPSIAGHDLLASLLITHVRSIVGSMKALNLQVHPLQEIPVVKLPKAMTADALGSPFYNAIRCFTEITPDHRTQQQRYRLHDLHLESHGTHTWHVPEWQREDVRYDSAGGLNVTALTGINLHQTESNLPSERWGNSYVYLEYRMSEAGGQVNVTSGRCNMTFTSYYKVTFNFKPFRMI